MRTVTDGLEGVVDHLFRQTAGQMVATLTRIFGAQHSKRYAFQTNLRSTLGSNLVNEFKVGFTGGATMFIVFPCSAGSGWSDSPIRIENAKTPAPAILPN